MTELFFPGACFDDESEFNKLRSQDLEERGRAWEKMINHYQAPLRKETRGMLGQNRLPTSDDDVDELVAHGWATAFFRFPTIQFDGEATLYTWIANVIERRIYSLRRQYRRSLLIGDLPSSQRFDSLTEAEQFDRIQQHLMRPSAEDVYLSHEKHMRLNYVVADVLEHDLSYWHCRLAALWFLYQRDARAISRFFAKKKLNSTLARVKRNFVDELTARLQSGLELTPDDTDIRECLRMVIAFRSADRDGDLNQSHPFLDYLQHFLPYALPDPDADLRWFQNLLVTLRGGSQ